MNKSGFIKLAAFLPLFLFLILDPLALLCSCLFSLSLRSVPSLICVWGTFFSICLACVKATLSMFRHLHFRSARLISFLCSAAVAIFATAGCLFLFFWSAFAYQPEHIVEKNDVRMLARVSSFLDESVSYYVYTGPIFYGKEVGYAYYGGGSGDPIADGTSPLYEHFWMQ